MQTQAVRMHRHGGPEVLEFGPAPLREPASGELLVRQTAIGLNFADVYQRQGAPGPHATGVLPIVPGTQGAGVVEAVGPGGDPAWIGREVAYIHEGLYAERAVVPAERTVPVGTALPADIAAAFLVRGLTAEYLLHRLYRVVPGQAVLVHAAAGGMGEVLCQWARALGAYVIGTVGSEAKADTARGHGCHAVVVAGREGWVDEVVDLTGGEGVHVVYDAVGRDVFVPSLACLRPRGMAINYGTASGGVDGFDLQWLHAKSLSVCRPTLRTFIADVEEMRVAARRFVAAIEAGELRLSVSRRYALRDVRQAHEDLECRRTTGASILVP